MNPAPAAPGLIVPDFEWRIHRIRSQAHLPAKAHPLEDAGWDLHYCAAEGRETDEPPSRELGDTLVLELGTGLEMAFSPGWFFRIEARSGWARQYGAQVLAGVVDSGYRGEVVVLLRVPLITAPDGRRSAAWRIRHGDKVAQGVFLPVPVVAPHEVGTAQELGNSLRQSRGWGSSG